MLRLHLLILFISFNVCCQKNQTFYFLVNKHDTLVKKISSDVFRIIDTTETAIEIMEPNTLGGDHTICHKFNSYDYEFDKNNDTIIHEEYINQLAPIRKRNVFLDVIKSSNIYSFFFFIEPTKEGVFIIHKVTPVFYE